MEMKSRQKEFLAENNKVLFKNRTYNWEKGEEIKNHGIQDLQLHVDKGQTLNVRSTPRKKFWVKEQTKKPNMTLFDKSLAFVEGKAYKTIET